jgi:hypothetical protein
LHHVVRCAKNFTGLKIFLWKEIVENRRTS